MPLLAEVAPVEGPLWAQIVYVVLTALVAMFLIPYLRAKQTEALAVQANHEVDAQIVEFSATSRIMGDVKVFLIERALNIVEREFPKIAKRVLAGELKTAGEIKITLRSFGTTLKTDAINYFKNHRGVDLISLVGNEQLDRLIECVANKVSPFPGKESAVEFLKSHVSNWIIEKGVSMVAKKYAYDTPDGDIDVPALAVPAAEVVGGEQLGDGSAADELNG